MPCRSASSALRVRASLIVKDLPGHRVKSQKLGFRPDIEATPKLHLAFVITHAGRAVGK